jgi:hypothetical protein
MSGVAAASQEAARLNYQLGQEQLAWAKDQFAQNQGTVDKVVDSLLSSQDANDQRSQEYYDRYKNVFQPAQDRYLADAEAYDTPERRDQEMGAAQANVAKQYDAARQAATQQLESFGINPGSTRFAALDTGVRAQEAAAKAAAGTQAARNTEQTGLALRANAINMGNGLPAQSVATSGVANSSGTGAVNSDLSGTASGASTMGTNTQYQGLGNSAIAGWGNALNTGYQNQLAQFKADQSASSGIGSLLGGALGIGAKFFGFAEGGDVPEAIPTNDNAPTQGGAIPMGVSPSAGQAVDDVPARLTAGEFIVPRDVASWKGEEFFQKLINQSRQAKQGAAAKPAIGNAPPEQPAVQSRPGAIPMGAAA